MSDLDTLDAEAVANEYVRSTVASEQFDGVEEGGSAVIGAMMSGYDAPIPGDAEHGMPRRPAVQRGHVPTSPLHAGVPSPQSLPKDLRTLEDVYAAYTIGDGEHFLRIERTDPKIFKGVRVAGMLGDLWDQISMDDFAARFGGYAYKVHVIGPAPGRSATGDRPLRTLATVEMRVAGPPVVEGLTPMEEPMTGQKSVRQVLTQSQEGQFVTPGMDKIVIEQMRLQERALQRQEDQRREFYASSRTPDEVIRAATEATKEAVNIARAGADQQVGILRDQNKGLMETLMRRDAELATLREKILSAEKAAAEARQFTETEQIKRLTEQHARDLARIQELHAREVQRLSTDANDKLAAETRRFTEERSRFESDGLRERSRLQEDAERRERALKEQYELIRVQVKEQYDSRIADLERRTSEQIQAVKEQRDRELESIRTSTRAEATVVEKTSTFRVDHLAHRVSELQGEAERLRRENEELRRASHKEPVAYLQEVEGVARQLLGMVKPEEVEQAAPPAAGEKDEGWKGIAAKGLMGLVDGLPKIVEQVNAVRAQNQQVRAIQAAQQQQVAQAQQRALPPATLRQVQQAAPMPGPAQRNLMASTPSWASSVPPAPGQALGLPSPVVAPVMGPPPAPLSRPVPNLVSGLAGAPAGVPMTGQMLVTGGSPVQFDEPQPMRPASPAPAQVSAPPPPVQSPPSPQAAEGGTKVEITQDQMTEFLSALNEYSSQGVPVAMFAKGFVEKVGPEVARDLMTKVKPSDIINVIAQADEDEQSYLLTASGRQYVTALWAEVGKIVG